MIIIDVEQGSPEWHLARAGKVTASRIQDGILAKARNGGESSGRRNYRAQLVSEILTGRPQEDGYMSKAMKDGIELEPFARAAYEVATDASVRRVGLVRHPTIERAAASPDGLVGEDGTLQIKCPFAATHISWLIAGEPPEEHRPQMLWEMVCTGRSWCDFVSYCEALPKELRIFRRRYSFEVARAVEITAEVKIFLTEVDSILFKLKGVKPT